MLSSSSVSLSLVLRSAPCVRRVLFDSSAADGPDPATLPRELRSSWLSGVAKAGAEAPAPERGATWALVRSDGARAGLIYIYFGFAQTPDQPPTGGRY